MDAAQPAKAGAPSAPTSSPAPPVSAAVPPPSTGLPGTGPGAGAGAADGTASAASSGTGPSATASAAPSVTPSATPSAGQAAGSAGGAVAPGGAGSAGTAAKGARRARVRNRLLLSVVVCALAVIGAGVPSVLAASDDVTESQHMVGIADLDKQTVALSHALADERDGMVAYVAAGRTSRNGVGLTETQRARVDQQIREVRADAPAGLRRSLAALPQIRQRALAGHGTALETFTAYTAPIDALQRVDDSLARSLPPRAEAAAAADAGTADALPDLGRAVEQAAGTEALLRAALLGRGTQQPLMEQAQLSNVREQAAYAEFDSTAGSTARDTYDKTVTGTDVTQAEAYLKQLTAQPMVTARDRAMSRSRMAAALSSRVDQMRGVQASFAADGSKRLEKLRDDDVTQLELEITYVVVFLLIAVGISVQTARSMARPLSVLTRGSRRLAADPTGGKPVEFHGRNDEFAEVVRSLNQLRQTAAALQERAAEAEADNNFLVESKDALLAERDRLQAEFDALGEQAMATHGAAAGSYVNLGMRTLGLVERQLGVIESLEEQETDPDQLGTLFKLDHLATRMRRHSENLLLLAGAEGSGPQTAGPVPLLDVLRAGISEIERYERAVLGTLPPHTQVAGFVSDDLSHLVAELLDNATSFSPPEKQVRISGWLLESGEVMLSVEDEGIGITARRLSALNARLTTPEAQQPPAGPVQSTAGGQGAGDEGELGMGLYVVSRLAARHGLRVQLRSRKQGGIAAVVAVPSVLLPARPAPSGSTAAEGARPVARGVQALPGSVAEANSNALPSRRTGGPGTDRTAPGGAHRAEGAAEPMAVEPGPAGGVAKDADEPAPGAQDVPDPAPGAAPVSDAVREPDAVRQPGTVRPAGGEAADGPADKAASSLNASEDPLVTAAERAIREAERPAPADGSASAGGPAPADGLGEDLASDLDSAFGVPGAEDDAHEHARDAAPVGDAEAVTPSPAESARPAAGPGPAAGTEGGSGSQDSSPAPHKPRLTEKGLPKRTPAQVESPSAPARTANHSADAEEIRRRLGGFYQGAQQGRRDAEAEVVAEENVNDQAGAQSDGGNAEEART